MDQEKSIRLKVEAAMAGGKAIEEQLRALLAVEKELVEQNQRSAAVARQRFLAEQQAAKARADQLHATIGIEQQLAEQNRRAAEAERLRAEAARRRASEEQAETNRQKGLLETLQSQLTRLEQAKARAFSFKEVRQLNQQISQTQRQIQSLMGTTQQYSNQLGSMQSLAATVFSFAALRQFGREIISVTSNMESFGIAMETMLGSKSKADALTAQTVALAKKSPMTLLEVQEQTKRLLAYGIESNKVIQTVTELGNIASGVGKEKLPFLTLAYGQVRAANKMTGQELRQFTEAGIPMLELLAQVTGKTVQQIQKDVPNGAITFKLVEKAIASASAEGGKFFNLMEKQSTTIEGRLSNFSDNVGQGLNRIGTRMKGAGLDFLDMAANFVEGAIGSESAINRTIGILKTGLSAWLSYRAILLAVTIQNRIKMASDLELVGVQRLLVVATGQVNAAQQGLWATLRANPIGLIVAAVGLAVTAYQGWKATTAEVTSAIGEQEAKIRAERDALFGLVAAIKDQNISSESRLGLIKQLKTEYPDLLKGIRAEMVTSQALDAALRGINSTYNERIRLARLAYVTEQNNEKRKSVYEREAEAIEQLKKANKDFKPVSLDLDGVIKEFEAFQKKNPTKEFFGFANDYKFAVADAKRTNGELKNTLGELNKIEQTAASEQVKIEGDAERRKTLQHEWNVRRRAELEKKINSSTKSASRADYQEMIILGNQIKAYEDAHKKEEKIGAAADANDKKWHNDKLTRALAAAKMQEEGIYREYAILAAEGDIAVDKARFAKATEAEIEEIEAEYFGKRQKLLFDHEEKIRKEQEKTREDRQKDFDKVLENERQLKEKILEQRRKQIEDLKKLDEEYSKLLIERRAVREEIETESARNEELSHARSAQARLLIERKYDNEVTNIRIRAVNAQIMREQARINMLKSQGNLSEVEAAKSRNTILKLETEIDQIKAGFTDRQKDRENRAAQFKMKLERETTSNIIQLLNQTENAYMRAFANMLAAYQQFLDKREAGEDTWKDKVLLGQAVLSAAATAFFSSEKERYDSLLTQAQERNKAEMEGLETKHKSDLDNFKGNAEQKKQLEARQQREQQALEEKQKKQEADLKLKAWKADQASKISQTIMSGTMAGLQAFNAAGGNPILGAVFAGIIAGVTADAVRRIAKEKPPKFYATGTEYVDDRREYPSGVDTVPAMLTRGESVLTVAQNDRKRAMGLTNEQLLKYAETYTLQPIRHNFVLEDRPKEKPSNPNSNVEQLLRDVKNELKGLKKTNIRIDQRGFRVWTQDRNRTTNYLNNQYFGS